MGMADPARAAPGGRPAPLRDVEIRKKLDPPPNAGDGSESEELRLYELGRRAWEEQRQWADETVIDEFPVGALPLRDLFYDRPDRWEACVSDLASASALCALLGGLDHRDSLRWAAEYEDFVRLLNLPDSLRSSEAQQRAAELVPQFEVDDIVYRIAVLLDTKGKLVTRSKPSPVIGAEWLTCPSTPGIREVVRRWALHSPGDPGALTRGLERLVAAGGDPASRSEAELALLVLDGRPMTANAASTWSLLRSLEATADAMIRSHSSWFRAVWAADSLFTEAERAAAHRFLLRTVFLVTGGPVPLDPDPLTLQTKGLRHPILVADDLARKLLARSWGNDQPDDLGLANVGPGGCTAVLGWLTTLPYARSSDLPWLAALWHEAMPNAMASLPGGLGLALRPLLAWAHEQEPALEPQLSAAARDALTASGIGQDADRLEPEIAQLYAQLGVGRGTPDLMNGERVVQIARVSSTARADLAYLLIAVSALAPEPGQARWRTAALDVLAHETDQEQLAEALYRVRDHLGDDPATRKRVHELAERISSPLLRAEAAGDPGQTAQALISRVGAALEPAAKVSLLIVARVVGELTRIAALTDLPGTGRVSAIGHHLTYPSSTSGREGPWRLKLDREALATIDPTLLADPDEDEATACWLSMVSRVEEDALPELEALIKRAPPGARWAATARNLITLQRAAVAGGYPGMFRDLAEMTLSADAAMSARAQLELVGPWRHMERGDRRYALSQYGLDRWWELGLDAATGTDPQAVRLYRQALHEWLVDDPVAVAEAARRAGDSEQSRAVWRRLVDTASIWHSEAQNALARYLDSPQADRADAEAALRMISLLATAHDDAKVTAELRTAVIGACIDRGPRLARSLAWGAIGGLPWPGTLPTPASR